MHVTVVGGGIAGLVAARELARSGAEVTLVEATPRLGGMLAPADLAGVRIDIGAEAFATRGGAVEALLAELGLGSQVVEPRPLGSWAVGASAYRLPPGGLVGIPTDASTPGLFEAIGADGVARVRAEAALDASVGADARTLAELVLARFGGVVLERLVAPVTRGVYSLDPGEIDPDALIPGLRAQLETHGSFAALAAARRSVTTPGALVRSVRGGMWQLVDALVAELAQRRVSVLLGEPVRAFQPGCVTTTGRTLESDAVLVTVPPSAELPWLDGWQGSAAEPVSTEVVALAVQADELDAHPRGTGVLAAAECPAQAKALTHVSAKWPWLAQASPLQVLRLSYAPRTAGAPARSLAWDASELAEVARRDASLLLGVDMPAPQAVARQLWQIPAPPARVGRAEAVARMRARVASLPQVEAAGTWIDGTGLATVVPGAVAAAQRLLG